MGKRKIILDSDESDYAGAPSPEPIVPKRVTKKAKTTKKVAVIVPEDAIPRPHARTLHEIDTPGPPVNSLLAWYATVHETRGMPWRKPFNEQWTKEERGQRAYEVWVSEIMLQQTQVATVIPYYNNWMEKFPTIAALAASDIETINGAWKGLGYYSRAARLLSGAQKTVDELNGLLPDNAKEMESKIPGIGRYSAGAICSIAYNQCVPVLDGNVNRLLSRYLAVYAPPKAKSTLDLLWAGATVMAEATDAPGNLNQGLIELGSTVCKVRDPDCSSCPLKTWCRGYLDSDKKSFEEIADIEDSCNLCEPLPTTDITVYPMKVERKKAREELDIVNVVEWRKGEDRRFLLVRRPEGGLLAGLHEFPTNDNVDSTSTAATNPQPLLKALLASSPLPLSNKGDTPDLRTTRTEQAGDVIHLFSHIRKTYRVQWVLLEGGEDVPGLAPFVEEVKPKGKGKKATTTKASRDKASPVQAMWVPFDEVKDANIGTGVVKVWKQVQSVMEE